MARKKPLLSLELAVKKGAALALKASAKLLEAKIKQNVSETDHTLKDLAALDHPYSAAHPKTIHDPDYIVHNQTGDLEDAVGTQIVNQYQAFVGVDENKAPHVVHVIFGTKDMIARDFITGSFEEIRPEITKLYEEMIGKELK